MKIRMKGNSLRLRVARSEMARLLKDGHIRETIRFAASPEPCFPGISGYHRIWPQRILFGQLTNPRRFVLDLRSGGAAGFKFTHAHSNATAISAMHQGDAKIGTVKGGRDKPFGPLWLSVLLWMFADLTREPIIRVVPRSAGG